MWLHEYIELKPCGIYGAIQIKTPAFDDLAFFVPVTEILTLSNGAEE